MKVVKKKTIGIRLTEAELKKIKKAATLQSLAASTYIRQIILREVQQ